MKKIEKIIKYINEDEYCIVNKELLISYFQDYKKHDCIQKSMAVSYTHLPSPRD